WEASRRVKERARGRISAPRGLPDDDGYRRTDLPARVGSRANQGLRVLAGNDGRPLEAGVERCPHGPCERSLADAGASGCRGADVRRCRRQSSRGPQSDRPYVVSLRASAAERRSPWMNAPCAKRMRRAASKPLLSCGPYRLIDRKYIIILYRTDVDALKAA